MGTGVKRRARSLLLAWALAFAVAGALPGLCAPARATDTVTARLDLGFGHAGRAFGEVGLGLDFDFFLEGVGVRIGGVTSVRDFVGGGVRLRALLMPELGLHFGEDGDTTRYFVLLQPEFLVTALGDDISPLHGLRIGPSVEWRGQGAGPRFGVGVFFAATHDPTGDITLAAGMLRLSVAWAFGGKPLTYDGDLCPDGMPPLPTLGCASLP